jgi:hypothetical protein
VLIQPSPTLSAIGATVCAGQPAVLTATGATSYLWNGPAGFTATTPGISVPGSNNLTSQIYTVTGLLGSCSSSIVVTLKVNLCAGIAENESRGVFKVFPNPNAGSFMIVSESPMQLVLINALGQTVKRIELPAENKICIDVPDGVYYLVSADGANCQKLLITR